jgi:hypothetical protein
MAEAADSIREVQDNTARAAQTVMDAAARTSLGALDEAGQTAGRVVDQARDVVERAAERLTDTAETAAETSAELGERGKEVLLLGVHTAAGVGGQLADLSYGPGHRVLGSSAQVLDVYRDAAERSAERVQRLLACYMTLGCGMQQMQHAWLEMLGHSLDSAVHKPQDVLRCQNVIELAEVQRELYLDAVNRAFDGSSRLLEIAGRTVQDAVRPMQSADL